MFFITERFGVVNVIRLSVFINALTVIVAISVLKPENIVADVDIHENAVVIFGNDKIGCGRAFDKGLLEDNAIASEYSRRYVPSL